MRKEPITFACVSTPRPDNLRRLVPKVLPYVDRVVLIFGYKDMELIEELKALDDKVEIYYRPWDDNFIAQFSCYLDVVEEGWILIVDDDEEPSEEALRSLDNIVNSSDYGKNHCSVGFRAHDVSEGVPAEQPSNFYKQMFFRYVPTLKYMGGEKTGCHQCITGFQNNNIRASKDVYFHIKPLVDEYQHATRNYFIYGIWLPGPQTVDGERREEWHELKNIIKRKYPHVEAFPDFDKILINGNVDNELKQWMVKWYNKFIDHPEYNEMRAVHNYYFKYLHPEESDFLKE